MTDYQFIKEDGIAFSTEKVFITNINQSVEIWIYTENESLKDFSSKQKRAFEEFLSKNDILNDIKITAKKCHEELLSQKRIKPSDKDSFEFDFQAIAIPSQSQTNENMIFLLADTNWQIADSECFIELEIYFENGVLTDMYELNGSYVFPY